MNYAVIKTGGKQYKVTQGEVITVERVPVGPNEMLTFPVLMAAEDGKVEFGQPLIEGFVVTGKVLEHIRGEKLRIAKFKAKARYRRVTGHRQELSKVMIETIGDFKKVIKSEAAPKSAEKTVKTPALTEKVVVKKPVKKTTEK